MAMSPRGIRAGAAYVELFVSDSRMVRGLRRAQWRLRRFGRSAMAIGKRLMAVSAVMAAPFAVATRQFAKFDDAMRVTRAVSRATEQEFQQLTETARTLGRTTSFTAQQVAEAMTELGRAGFRPREIDNAIAGILDLARATDTDLPRAAEIAGASLRGFGMTVGEIGRVVDVLSYTANASAMTLDDLGESMKYVAPIAAASGEEIESVAGALGALANAGIKGSQAGTAIRRSLLNLARDATHRELEKLGVQAADAEGNLRPLADILEDLGRATEYLGSAQRLAVFERMFGRGTVAALKLAEDPNAMAGLVDGLRRSAGYASETAEAMDAGIGGTMRRLRSAAEGVFLAIGDAIEKPLTNAMNRVRDVAEMLESWIRRNQRLVVVILKAVLAVGVLGAAVMTLGLGAFALSAIIGTIATAFGVLASMAAGALKVLAVVMSKVAALAGVMAATGTGVLVASGVIGDAIRWLGDMFGRLRDDMQVALAGIRDALIAGEIGLAADVLWATLKKAWREGIHALSEMWSDFKFIMLSTLSDAFYGAVAMLAHVGPAFQRAWASIVADMKGVWREFTADVRTGWEIMQTWLAKRMVGVMGRFDESLDVEEVRRGLDEQMTDTLVDIEQQRRRDEEKAEQEYARRMREIQAEKSAVLAEIGKEADETLAALATLHEAEIEENREKINAARAELKAARERAAQAREEAEAARKDVPTQAADAMDEMARRLAGIAGAGMREMEHQVRGTFDPHGAHALAGGRQMDELVKRAIRIDENTKRMFENARRFPTFG